jgi:hypothetical protein
MFSVVHVTTVSRQLLGKHVPGETNIHGTIEVMLEMGVLSVRVERL